MDKRCLKQATKDAFLALVVALVFLLLLNTLLNAYSFFVIVIFSLTYSMGVHMGFCMGFYYKTLKPSTVLLILAVVDAMLLLLPLLTKQELNYELNMAIFFSMAYYQRQRDGKKYYDKICNDD